jgi:hypothetical protein
LDQDIGINYGKSWTGGSSGDVFVYGGDGWRKEGRWGNGFDLERRGGVGTYVNKPWKKPKPVSFVGRH